MGGGCHYGFPCLVIDSGTALTFSGADEKQNFQGGYYAGGKITITNPFL